MRIFKNKLFHKWAKKIGIDDEALKKTIDELKNGLYDAKLSGNLYKKRIGTKKRGKSGSVRTIIAFKKENKLFFVYGYAKRVRANVNKRELLSLIKIAETYFLYDDSQIKKAIDGKKLFEVL